MPSTPQLHTLGFTSASFAAFLESRDEPGWLLDQRRAAWTTFESLPMPSRNDEEWMRTDLRTFHLDRFGPPEQAAPGGELPEALLSRGVDLAGSTVALDSRPVAAQLDARWSERGVLFGSLDELVLEHGELIKPHLFRAMKVGYDKFSALHAACWSGGSLLYVPRGVKIDKPFHTLSALSDGGVDFGHILVILEEGAEATVLSEAAGASASGTGLHCGGIELIVGPEAKLQYVNLQNWGHGVWHFAHQKGLVDRDAGLQWTIGALGSPAGESESACRIDRNRSRNPSERRDVHRRQAAFGLSHAAAS